MFIRTSHKKMEEAGEGDGLGGGDGGATFQSTLGEGLADNPSLKDFSDVGALAKSYVELKSFQGNSLRIPGEDASSDDRQAFINKMQERVPELMLRPSDDNMDEVYSMMGRPEDADSYKVPEIADGKLADERVAFLKEVAHKHGLSNKQFEGYLADVVEADLAALEEQSNEVAESMNGLKSEWGLAFDERASIAEKMREAFFGTIPADQLPAHMVKSLYEMSKQMGKETLNMVNEGNQNRRSPEEAQLQLSEIMGNREHPYWKASDPGNAAAKAKVQKLNEEIYGTAGVGNTKTAGVGGIQFS